MPTFSVHTLGCRANQSDSERLVEILAAAGFEEVPFGTAADCQIVNTCTVTRQADAKSIQLIRRAERLGGQTVVTGCGVAAKGGLANRLPGSVLRLPSDQQSRILDLLDVDGCPTGVEFARDLQKSTRAQLRIQDGCDQFCTFCIVPYVRGRSRSRTAEALLQQVRDLEQRGYAEVVLTGIHLSVWGHELEPRSDLAALLRLLLGSTDRIRIRLGSVEPDLFPTGVLDLMNSPRLCPHLHLVLQHASDAILERMHRGYDLAHYDAIVRDFLARFPGACLTTDVMVGFPGESEADFETLVAYLEGVPMYRIHVFPYSRRPGTAAAKFDSAVPAELVEQRRQTLLRLAERKKIDFIESCLGQTRTVVLENREPRAGWVQGTADNYLSVEVPSEGTRRGQVAKVKLNRRLGDQAVGEIQGFLDPT
jgi:threonylcarbamoyladenosine tRNA methylthiotransferase MtaB